MNITHDGWRYTASLGDDGTLDTVVEINGKEYRVSQEFASEFRKPDGSFSIAGFRHLVIAILDEEDILAS